MTISRWTPHVTVATLVERTHKGVKEYLLVREAPDNTPVFNQPAGHLDEGESLLEAAARETLEETAWQVEITDYLGMYRYLAPNDVTYLRHGFAARAVKHRPECSLDSGIIEALWLDYESILELEHQMRSPMVKRLIDDFRTGVRYPLSVFREFL